VSDAPSRPAVGARGARRWGPLLAWTAAILVVTSWPDPNVPDVRHGDKLVHALIYGVLAFLAWRAAFPSGRWPGAAAALALLAAVAAFGWLDEWHQQFIPGRAQSTADWQADTAGAAIGAAAAYLGRRRAHSLS
jgi:VanZ family protein